MVKPRLPFFCLPLLLLLLPRPYPNRYMEDPGSGVWHRFLGRPGSGERGGKFSGRTVRRRRSSGRPSRRLQDGRVCGRPGGFRSRLPPGGGDRVKSLFRTEPELSRRHRHPSRESERLGVEGDLTLFPTPSCIHEGGTQPTKIGTGVSRCPYYTGSDRTPLRGGGGAVGWKK